ncbi:aldo/keto reductase [Streptococcus pantholopis]|uniref:Oxidoreductase n=1 Tax=Streptococcus pantholopis TaxID=1811193 RepID=A0A172Q7T2_9STRE|nr:aldo/keto reductase [Streptococcus pantholopis]AND79510.1 oxidoreductase [Streptococcus pantholopis]
MEYLTLNNKIQIPILGFGTYSISPRQTKKYVSHAITAGYRLIDTAQYYHNEREVGQALAESGLKRSEFFITTKTQTDGYKATVRGLNKSLRLLGGDYCDLVLIHWPTTDSLGTYKALEEFYYAGKIKAIGLSNFNHLEVDEIIKKTEVKPVINQIETHPFFQQKKMHRYLNQQGLVHEAWSPLGEGMSGLLTDPAFKKLAEKYKKSAAQIILRFLTQEGIVVIPRSTNPQHIKDNIAIFDFQLTEEEISNLRQLDKSQSITGWPQTMAIEK